MTTTRKNIVGYKHCAEGHIIDPSWKKCPVCIAPISGWFVHLTENKADRVYPVHEGKSFVGSGAECELRIIDCGLSRQHAYLAISDDMCSIVDMGNNPNPLRVNKMETVKATLIDGDIVQLGDHLFKIKLL